MVHIDMFGRGLPLQVAISVACSMAFILFGYDQGVFSGIVGNDNFLEIADHPGNGLLGIIVAIYTLGCLFGCVLAFFIGDWLGRRRAMWFAMFWIIIGATLQTSAFSVTHLMIARFITGIGTGIETSTVPMYQSELCEADKRGRLVCSEPLFVGVGIVTAYFFDYGMSFVDHPVGVSWRLPIACQMLFAFVVIVLVFGLPESPRQLYKNGKNDEALQVLCDIYDREPEDPRIVHESGEILEALAIETKYGEYEWKNILKKDDVHTGQRVALAYGMQFMNQMGGINLVVYYVPTVLENNVGLTRNLSLIIGGCVQIMFVVGSFFPAFFIDRYGRRNPMMWGTFGLGVSMMMIAILLSFKGTSVSHPTSSASVAFFFTYMLIFGASCNCIPWCYVPEILPLHVRAKGTAVGISANWLWNFFVVMVTPTLINSLQWKAYLVFMCTSFAFVPLVYFCYPETAELSLEEIDFLFTEEGVSAVKVSRRVRKERRKGGRRVSIVGNRGGLALPNGRADAKSADLNGAGESVEQIEKV